MFNSTKLTPSLFSDSTVDDVQDLRTSRINLVHLNTRIIDRHKNWNILLFKEAIKIKGKKPILNTNLKASKELRLFWSHCVNHLSINLCKVLIVVQSISIQTCICCTSSFILSEDGFDGSRNIKLFTILTYCALFRWLK